MRGCMRVSPCGCWCARVRLRACLSACLLFSFRSAPRPLPAVCGWEPRGTSQPPSHRPLHSVHVLLTANTGHRHTLLSSPRLRLSLLPSPSCTPSRISEQSKGIHSFVPSTANTQTHKHTHSHYPYHSHVRTCQTKTHTHPVYTNTYFIHFSFTHQTSKVPTHLCASAQPP